MGLGNRLFCLFQGTLYVCLPILGRKLPGGMVLAGYGKQQVGLTLGLFTAIVNKEIRIGPRGHAACILGQRQQATAWIA